MTRKTKQSDKAIELGEEELDQVQGGGISLSPAGQGAPDLKKNQPTLQRPSKNFPQVDNWIPQIDNW